MTQAIRPRADPALPYVKHKTKRQPISMQE